MNDEFSRDELLRRLDALEKEVQSLRQSKGGVGQTPPPLPRQPQTDPVGDGLAARAMERSRALLGMENLLSKLGIVVLVIGLLLLLKYSLELGWLTPWWRVGGGWVLGAALAVAGWRLSAQRAVLGPTLMAGGWVIFYAVTVAGVQLYELFGPSAGFLIILTATVAAFAWAMARGQSLAATWALAGAILAPFFLNDQRGLAVVPMVIFNFILMLASAVAYQRRGWGAIYWAGFLLIGLAFFVLEMHVATVEPGQLTDRMALTAAWMLWWSLHAVMPVLRVRRGGMRGDEVAVHVTSLLAPAVSILGIVRVWELTMPQAGVCLLVGGLLTGAAAGTLTGAMRRSYLLAAGLLSAVGLVFWLEGDTAFAVMLALAVGLAESSRRSRFPVVEALAHVAALVLAVWWGVRMSEHAVAPAMWRLEALLNLAVAGFAVMVYGQRREEVWRWIYWVVAVLFLLVWIAREAGVTSEPMVWTTAGWGLVALSLLVISVVWWNPGIRRTGVLVLLLVLGKLFLVDLAAVEPVWRVLLFIGLGGLMLGCSYLLPRLVRQEVPTHREPPPLPPPLP